MATTANKPLNVLTARDREVLRLIMEDMNNRQIADRLGLAHQTIKNLVSQLYKKLNQKGRTGLTLWAVKHGYENPAKIAPWLDQKHGGDA